MSTTVGFDGSSSLLTSEFGYAKKPEMGRLQFGPAITISQQTGSGGHEIAERTASILQQSDLDHGAHWDVFDRQLVEKVLEEHAWPARVAKYIPEDRRSYVQEVIDELLGVRPPSWVLIPQMAETILGLVKTGHVILVGRGAMAIAAEMPGVFHVRLVASLPRRIERVKNVMGLNVHDSMKHIRREDRGSRRYTQAHFHMSVDNDLLYHLVINTDRMPFGDAAVLIAAEARKSFERDAELKIEH